ncbi:MAG: hypothetical protein MI919_34905, partial [Holophagales bacterium]|nr:hypothetical protein [Holophagales bacterium]
QLEQLLLTIPDVAGDPSGGPTTWLLTHRPTWAVDGSNSVAVTLETAFANALANLGLEAPPAGLTLMVAGHMHIFQSATFPAGSGRPPQLVVGNSGVKMYEPDPEGAYARTIDGLEAQGLAFAHHGFLDISTFDPATGAWTGQIVNPAKNEVYATCDSSAPGGSICVEAGSSDP